MAVSEIYDGESGTSVLAKWNEVIGLVNDFDTAATSQEKTLVEVQTLITNGTLVPNAVYHVTDLDVYFRAMSATTFESKGVRKMLVPSIYELTTDSYSNEWKSIWYTQYGSYTIDDLVIHYGHVYKSLTGAVGTSGAGTYGLELDDTNWSKIEKASFTNHEYTTEYYGCSVDWRSGYIIAQWDAFNNLVETGIFSIMYLGYNSVDYCDWNWNSSQTPTSTSLVGGFYENNTFKFRDSDVDGGIVGFANNAYTIAIGNTCVSILSNLACHVERNIASMIALNVGSSPSHTFDIIMNTVGDIGSNVASSSSACITYNNIPGDIITNTISGNINMNTNKGNISNNTVGEIEANSNLGRIADNSIPGGSIDANVNLGYITNNECGGNIVNNSNAANIVDNTNTGGITGNRNSGNINNNANSGDILTNTNIGAIYNNTVNVTDIDTNRNNGVIYANQNTGTISGNSNAGGIYENTNTGNIEKNTCTGDIQNNGNGGSISNNFVIGSIYDNSNTGAIAENNCGDHIRSNSNGGTITDNGNRGGIYLNTNSSYISSNRNNGDIQSNSMTGYITHNQNNGAISTNNGTGNIQYNVNNGYITGNTLTANIEDTVVNKE